MRETWVCDWEVQNVFLLKHGETGRISVRAVDEASARRAARCKVSCQLFGGTTLYKDDIKIKSAKKKRN